MWGLFFKASLLSIALSACQKKQVDAEQLLFNGQVHSLNENDQLYEAVAINKGEIIAVGRADSLRDRFDFAEEFDLKGRHIYPSFNDAHAHFVGYAEGLLKVNLLGTKSAEEVIARCQTFAATQAQAFIVGRGWDQNDWPEKSFPDKAILDSVFPQTPVVLKRIDGHAAWVNQAALDYAGITAETSVEGGKILLQDGQPSGILIDNAVNLVKLPEMKRSEKARAILQAQDSVFKYGLASLTDAGLGRSDIELLDSLQQAGALKLRINAMVRDDSASLAYFLKNGAIEKPRLRVKSAKYYLDGALGSRGALLIDPYADDPANYGLQLIPTDYFRRQCERMLEAGWQVCVHAIGDSANRLAVRVMADVLQAERDRRWRIEHAQIVRPIDVAAMAEYNIIPSVQPTHATSDMYWAEARLGERIKYAYPYGNLWKACSGLPLGTDFPVEAIDPLRTYRAAVFRQDDRGFPEGGFLPKQKLSPFQALRGMTYYGAEASFEEDKKGLIAPGYYADLVIFDKAIEDCSLAEINRLRPLALLINGETVLASDGLAL